MEISGEEITETELVEEAALPELPEVESIGTGPLTLQPTEAVEAGEPESILTDESAAAAAAAIGIPLFAERATKAGVTESLPPLTSAQIPTDEEQPTAEVFAEEPVSEEPAVVAEEPAVTEEMVSEALESIMVSEETPAEMVAEPVEEITVTADEPAIPEEPVIAEEPVSEVPAPVEPTLEPVAEDLVAEPVFTEPTETPAPVVEEFVAEAVVEQPVEVVQEESQIPEALPEPEFDTLFSNARRMVEAGDYATAQPALTSLISADQNLDEIIGLMQDALQREPTDFNLWMTLGDAYGHSGKLQNALDAYTKAEEYLQ